MLKAPLRAVAQLSFALGLVCLLSGSVASAQAEKSPDANSASVAGTWKMVSETPDGDPIPWTLTLTQADGHWTATVGSSDSQAAPASNVKVAGNTVHLQTQYQGSPYDIDLKLANGVLAGTWNGESGSGKTSGKRLT
jgi:hypothetical protein